MAPKNPQAGKKKSSTPKPTAKKRRDGPGRPTLLGERMDAGIFVRCSEAQKSALEAFVASLNETRAKAGLPGTVSVSTWLRELGLKYAGAEHLGAAARARAEAEAASSIV